LSWLPVGRFYHAAIGEERRQGLTDIAGAHAHTVTNLLLREGLVHAGEDLFESVAGRKVGGLALSVSSNR
jgi:hypothetical protein